MAGAEKIVSRILDDAQAQAALNKQNANREAANYMKTAKQNVEEWRKKAIVEAQQEADAIKRRLLATAELESKKALLQAKQDTIDLAFSKALDKLCSLPDEKYQQLLIDLIVGSAESGIETVSLAKQDYDRVGAGFLERINQNLVAKGLPGKVKLATEPAAIRGGFILKADKIELNYSFEAMIKLMYNDLAMEVANALF